MFGNFRDIKGKKKINARLIDTNGMRTMRMSFELFLLLFVLILAGCNWGCEIYKEGDVIIGEQKISVEIADKPELIQRGLAGRDRLTENQGMLFIFDETDIHEFWMKDMKFPLDIIWINNDKIVEIWSNAPVPQNNQIPQHRPASPANYVLEINSGLAIKYGWKIGDKVTLIFNL